jgi:integrase
MRDGLYRRDGSETWYALVYHEGRRIRQSTGTSNKKEARRIREQIKARLHAESRIANTTTWKDACIRWLNAGDRSDNDRYILRGLNYEDRPLEDCTAESFDAAIQHLSKATYNRYRAIIVAVCRMSGHNLKMPIKRTKNVRLRFLTKEEWCRLYEALPAHLKAPAHFSLLTGLRQANVTQLRWDQIDLAGGRMWVHADMAKGERNIGIPLSPEAIEVLKGQAGKSKEWVFPYHGRGRKKGNDAPMTKVKTAWQLAMERAGLGHFKRWKDEAGKAHKEWVGDFTWHGLRHTWASWHLMAGTPIETLAKLGGWEDLRMVQKHYGHLATEHLARYAGNAVPWSREKQPQEQPQQLEAA